MYYFLLAFLQFARTIGYLMFTYKTSTYTVIFIHCTCNLTFLDLFFQPRTQNLGPMARPSKKLSELKKERIQTTIFSTKIMPVVVQKLYYVVCIVAGTIIISAISLLLRFTRSLQELRMGLDIHNQKKIANHRPCFCGKKQ